MFVSTDVLAWCLDCLVQTLQRSADPPCKEPYKNVYSTVRGNKGVEKTT